MFLVQSLKKNLTVGTRNDSDREAWVTAKLAQIPAGQRILDAGAGQLRYKPKCAHLKYVSQDFGQYTGTGDAKGLQTGTWDQTKLDITCDITNIPVPDKAFDAILCVEVFEHLPNPLLALKEFSRLLRSGGQLVLTAPFNSLTHFAPYHFCAGFNRYFYETHLKANGFKIVELSENGNFFEYAAQEVRRINETARQYTDSKPRLWEYASLYVVLKMLQRLSRRDKGSKELGNFGFHVHAIKE